MLKWIILTVVTLTISAATVVAGEIEDLAREAEAKMNAGQHVEGVELLRRAINLLTAKAPLTLRRVQFVQQPPRALAFTNRGATISSELGSP